MSIIILQNEIIFSAASVKAFTESEHTTAGHQYFESWNRPTSKVTKSQTVQDLPEPKNFLKEGSNKTFETLR